MLYKLRITVLFFIFIILFTSCLNIQEKDDYADADTDSTNINLENTDYISELNEFWSGYDLFFNIVASSETPSETINYPEMIFPIESIDYSDLKTYTLETDNTENKCFIYAIISNQLSDKAEFTILTSVDGLIYPSRTKQNNLRLSEYGINGEIMGGETLYIPLEINPKMISDNKNHVITYILLVSYQREEKNQNYNFVALSVEKELTIDSLDDTLDNTSVWDKGLGYAIQDVTYSYITVNQNYSDDYIYSLSLDESLYFVQGTNYESLRFYTYFLVNSELLCQDETPYYITGYATKSNPYICMLDNELFNNYGSFELMTITIANSSDNNLTSDFLCSCIYSID